MAGLSERFELPVEETYGESFDVAHRDQRPQLVGVENRRRSERGAQHALESSPGVDVAGIERAGGGTEGDLEVERVGLRCGRALEKGRGICFAVLGHEFAGAGERGVGIVARGECHERVCIPCSRRGLMTTNGRESMLGVA